MKSIKYMFDIHSYVQKTKKTDTTPETDTPPKFVYDPLNSENSSPVNAGRWGVSDVTRFR